MRTLKEMTAMYESGDLTLLTPDQFHNLIGEKISTIYFGYCGQDGVDSFIVGKMMSKYEIAKETPCEGFNNLAEYWESSSSPVSKLSIENDKCTYTIVTNTGRITHINYNSKYGEYFWCTDSDRFVYFTKDEN